MLNTNNQSGATLFIGLILLLAISIISLAAMRTSLLDLSITNNKQQFANTFEASEQVINTRLTNMRLAINGTELVDSVVAGSVQNIQVTTPNSAGANVAIANVVSNVTYRTEGSGAGWEMSNAGSAFHFQLNTQAQAPGRGANSNHRIGFFIVAPVP